MQPKVRYRTHMSQSGRGRMAWALLGFAALFIIAVYLIPRFIDRSDGQQSQNARGKESGRCTKHRIKHLRVPVAEGEHRGEAWSVISSIENGHACGKWALGMEILPQNVTPGSWKGMWEIPASGHLPASATISARDETTGESRVVSGIVGWHVRSVVFKTRSGRRFVAYPKAPEAKLLKRFVWLRNLRYFLRFYPLGDPVKVAKLRDSRGAIIETARFRLGEVMGIA